MIGFEESVVRIRDLWFLNSRAAKKIICRTAEQVAELTDRDRIHLPLFHFVHGDGRIGDIQMSADLSLGHGMLFSKFFDSIHRR